MKPQQKNTKHSIYSQKDKTMNVQRKSVSFTLPSWENVRIPYQTPVMQTMYHSPGNVIQREIVPIEQTGPNCGMFAMAMALSDLLRADGKEIARGLETLAIQQHHSVAGEAFDADELCQLGHDYCKNKNANIMFITLEFNKPSQLRAIFDKCSERELYVLFPYFATDNINPDTYNPKEKANPEKMTNAHWSVIERLPFSDQKYPLRILEGWNSIYASQQLNEKEKGNLNHSRVLELFIANKKLGDLLSWKKAMQVVRHGKYDDGTLQNNINARHCKYPSKFINKVDPLPQEKVNLRGRAILVGKADPVSKAVNDLQTDFGVILRYVSA